ncbi:hypothetical protein WICMUC_002144 [Wickerhamomyces mucosus]|uniref:Mss4-like protein n=1 Tax=Wickerhamomyces mucosus TaxID=1378264 RepID=A0A9P8PQL0_9ASCO|nr:hypothetical protein WICMUC_002144 [Wickerhamomyces mucosus]
MSTAYTNYSSSLDLSKKLIIRCPFSKCHTRLIQTHSPNIQELDIKSIKFLKTTNPDTNPTTIEEHDSNLNKYIKIDDVWDFDNIGVSKEFNQDQSDSVKLERLIICSDCERGPLGFATFEDNSTDVKDLKYYLHLDSVVYQTVQ